MSRSGRKRDGAAPRTSGQAARGGGGCRHQLAAYDSLADWEAGHLLAELRTGRFTGTPFEVVTVAESLDPVTTMGGLRLLPDMLVSDLDPAASDLLVLPGAMLWDAGGGAAFANAAARFLAAEMPVAAICGATAGLARAGILDDRRHTSAAAAYLTATGYAAASTTRTPAPYPTAGWSPPDRTRRSSSPARPSRSCA
jgi:putative intracellular protease/amidase